jgi:hypothetical protein
VRTRFCAAAAVFSLAAAAPAVAQSGAGASISIGEVGSVQSCTYLPESAGRAGVAVTPYAAAAYAEWRTWWVKDCVDNFATLRTSLQAALASGGMDVRGGRGNYVMSVKLSAVSGGPGGGAPYAPDMGPDGYSIATVGMRVNADVTVRDRSGRVVFGKLLTKTIETGHEIRVGDFRTRANDSGESLYGQLQHQVSLAVARAVAFHFRPLQVTGGDGRQITLNYGDPLLTLGTVVEATSPDGSTALRYDVTSAANGSAIARTVARADAARIVPGSRARVIEADDPAANGRLFQKVDLP